MMVRAVDPELLVSEIFGPTFQGEGPSMGRLCSFIRLAGCNLRCTWCDTKYTWDWTHFSPKEETSRWSWDKIVEEVVQHETSMVVITGGEPLLQQEKLIPLLFNFMSLNRRVELETAGTISPSVGIIATVDQFNVSPKLEHSGNSLKDRYKPSVLKHFASTGKAIFKFVVRDVSDLEEVSNIVGMLDLPTDSVYIMPEGTTELQLTKCLQEIAPRVIECCYNITTRMHVYAFGNKRGI